MKKYTLMRFENTHWGTVAKVYNAELHCYQSITFNGYSKREMIQRLRNESGVVVPKRFE